VRAGARGGNQVFHYMGCSTFANFTVLPEIAVAKVREDAPFDKICYIGCGVTTGIGAVIYTAKVWPGANVVVFGLGGIGLNVIQGARMVGADRIIGVDINPAKQEMARKFGMTHFVNPNEVGNDKVVQALVDLTAAAPTSPSTAPATSTSCARRWNAATAAGARASSSAWPRREGDRDAALPARHRPRLEGQRLRRRARAHRRAEDRGLVHGGEDQHRRPDHPHHAARPHQRGFRPDARRQVHPLRRGVLTEWRPAANAPASAGACASCRTARRRRDGDAPGGLHPAAGAGRHAAPALYFLAGLECTEETFVTKAGAQRVAADLGLVLVAPDTSPRGAGIPGEDADWDFGTGAGFYLDATQDPWSRHYRMASYVNAELPALVEAALPVLPGARGITGHSMGGHGAIVSALRNPGRGGRSRRWRRSPTRSRCPGGRRRSPITSARTGPPGRSGMPPR
jgi:hypothetical protein